MIMTSFSVGTERFAIQTVNRTRLQQANQQRSFSVLVVEFFMNFIDRATAMQALRKSGP